MNTRETDAWINQIDNMSLSELARLFLRLSSPIDDEERHRLYLATYPLIRLAEAADESRANRPQSYTDSPAIGS